MDDLISRQAAVDAICEDGTQRERQGQYSMTMVDRKYRDIEILEALPPAQPSVSKMEIVGDVISRQAALTALERDEEYDNDIPNRADGVRDSIITISALPSAQPGWIPVTERLPEKDGEYLVTIDWGDGDTEVDCYDYCANGTDWNDGDLFGAKVLAWMPLPKTWENE